jgi:hypothetical protein
MTNRYELDTLDIMEIEREQWESENGYYDAPEPTPEELELMDRLISDFDFYRTYWRDKTVDELEDELTDIGNCLYFASQNNEPEAILDAYKERMTWLKGIAIPSAKTR